MKGKYQDWITEDGCLRIKAWARDGLTDEQISKQMGVSYSTFRDWVSKFPALSAALKEGKAPVDAMVEDALFQKAIKGDTTAIIFWLKNRRPDVWRDRRDKEDEKDKSITIKLDETIKQFCK